MVLVVVAKYTYPWKSKWKSANVNKTYQCSASTRVKQANPQAVKPAIPPACIIHSLFKTIPTNAVVAVVKRNAPHKDLCTRTPVPYRIDSFSFILIPVIKKNPTITETNIIMYTIGAMRVVSDL